MSYPPPCLHRIHRGELIGSLKVHHSLGMSIQLETLIERLEQLNGKVEQQGGAYRSQLVTFDDGWADVMLLTSHFDRLPCLQPALFLTAEQCAGGRSLLPLPRLYEWCATNRKSVDALNELGLSRSQLKLLSERAQHERLDQLGIPRVEESLDLLSCQQIRDLVAHGWLVGSHGADHCDLRYTNHNDLIQNLENALRAVRAISGVPWLAWPEGRCSEAMCESAAAVGFTQQFSLYVESGALQRIDLLHREIWQ